LHINSSGLTGFDSEMKGFVSMPSYSIDARKYNIEFYNWRV